MADTPAGGRRNVEIKARVADPSVLEQRVAILADSGPVQLAQHDTFFRCGSGRLKLRQLAPDRGELIHYRRADQDGPKLSHYAVAPTSDPAALRALLAQVLGVAGQVRKQRRLYLVGRTRIHLDRVEGLGDFVELEVVLDPAEEPAAGEAEAVRLMTALGIATTDLVDVAYVDLAGHGD